MTTLSPDQRRRFVEDGILFPLYGPTPAEIERCANEMAAFGAARGGSLPPALNLKPHLLFPRLWALVHDPRIVEPVAELLGPDILCWASSFFDKAPDSDAFVAWHQDATYWGLDRPDALTAWIAFTEADRDNGCLRVVPGSHRAKRRHVELPDSANMLAGGETLAEHVEEDRVVDIELRPGEMSLHHLLLVHGSERNRSGRRRSGFAIRYIAGSIRQQDGARGSATLVRGRDHGTFDLEQAPHRDLDPAALRRHGGIYRRATGIVADRIRQDRDPRADASA